MSLYLETTLHPGTTLYPEWPEEIAFFGEFDCTLETTDYITTLEIPTYVSMLE